MRRWIKGLFCETLDPVLRNQFIIQEQLKTINERLDSLSIILAASHGALERLEGANATSAEIEKELQKPIASSRGAWPRMKKLMEENDVLNLRKEANNHAAQLEEYWKRKGESDVRTQSNNNG